MILCAGAMLTGLIAMNTANRASSATDRAISLDEAETVARENATSALNMAFATAKGSFGALLGTLQLNQPTRRVADMATAGATDYAASEASFTRLSGTTIRIDAVGREPIPGSSPLAFKTVRLSKTVMQELPFNAAIIIETDIIVPAFKNGGTYGVTGRDTRPPSGTRAPNAAFDRHGLQTNLGSVAAKVAAQMIATSAGLDKVTGKGGTGDIVAGNVRVSMQDIFDEARALPSRIVLTSDKLGPTIALGTPSNPVVVYRKGDLDINGSGAGYGILVVENGTLKFGSSFTWEGLVLVKQETADMGVELSGNSSIYGALVMIDGSSAFTMPADGRIKIRYLKQPGGSALRASISVAPNGFATSQVYAAGSNVSAEQYTDWTTTYEKGQQLNFIAGFHLGSFSTRLYQHAARGFYAASSGRPYGYVTRVGPALWRIAFEETNEMAGVSPDYDYATAGQEDQVIEVEAQCNAAGTWRRCVSSEVDYATRSWSSFPAATATRGPKHTFELKSSAGVYYSVEALERLAFLPTIRAAAPIVTVDQWAR